MDIDTQTNLPVLPEGYWWRIVRTDYPFSFYDIQIVTNKKVWWSRKPRVVVLCGVMLDNEATLEEQIADIKLSAESAMKMFLRSQISYASFVGDYPPRRLS